MKRVPGIAAATGRFAVAATLLVLARCTNSLRPDQPDDIGAWMELYRVPGASVDVIRDFQVTYTEVHGAESQTTLEPVTPRTLFQAAWRAVG